MSLNSAVIDASVVVDVLFNTSAGSDLIEHVVPDNWRLVAPHLLDVEVAEILSYYSESGEITSCRALQALEDFAKVPIVRYSHEPILNRIWELRTQAAVDGAVYLALAEALGLPLLTSDPLLGTIEDCNVRILRFGDY